jgi:hypothetical protein
MPSGVSLAKPDLPTQKTESLALQHMLSIRSCPDHATSAKVIPLSTYEFIYM